MKLYDTEWWQKVLDDWNQSESKNKFSNLGCVKFEFLEADIPPVVITWDSLGNGEINFDKIENINCFSATIKNWTAFINGEFKATMGVLQGKIKFDGNVFKILPFTNSFNKLAEISKRHLN